MPPTERPLTESRAEAIARAKAQECLSEHARACTGLQSLEKIMQDFREDVKEHKDAHEKLAKLMTDMTVQQKVVETKLAQSQLAIRSHGERLDGIDKAKVKVLMYAIGVLFVLLAGFVGGGLVIKSTLGGVSPPVSNNP